MIISSFKSVSHDAEIFYYLSFLFFVIFKEPYVVLVRGPIWWNPNDTPSSSLPIVNLQKSTASTPQWTLISPSIPIIRMAPASLES